MSLEYPIVKLTQRELMLGSIVGLQRQVECQASSKNGNRSISEYQKRYGNPGVKGLWNNAIEGALGELALAKHLNVYHTGIGGYNYVDVGEFYEVRTRPEVYQQLFVKKKDNPDKYYVLVQGAYGEYKIRGWICGKEVFSTPSWYHSNGGNTSEQFWVPLEKMHHINELPKVAP